MSQITLSEANNGLKTLFNFTSEDLELNKLGKLSRTQLQNEYQKMDSEKKVIYKIVYTMMFISTLIVGYILLTSGKARENLLLTVIPFAVMLVVYYFGIRFGIKYTDKKNKKFLSEDAKVQCLKGTVELVTESYNGNSRTSGPTALASAISGVDLQNFHIIKISGESINVDKKTLSLFEDGQKYSIYVVKLPPSGNIVMKRIFAVERMG